MNNNQPNTALNKLMNRYLTGSEEEQWTFDHIKDYVCFDSYSFTSLWVKPESWEKASPVYGWYRMQVTCFLN